MRSQNNRKLASVTLAVICGLGFSGCQRAHFPNNPFAGKIPSLPVPKMFAGKLKAPQVQPIGGRLPVPKLPSMSNFPRPNFGNLVRTVRTPAADAMASRSNQPPEAPARNFDTSSADKQIAAGRMPADVKSKLDLARKAAEASRDAVDTAQTDFNSAVAGTKAPSRETPSSDSLFSKIKTKPTAPSAKQTASSSSTGNLWGDYQPDTRPGSSNRASGGLEDLAKVNPRLYDRYGKLTSGNGSPSGQFVATNTKKDFDFQPVSAPEAKTNQLTDKTSSDNPDATIAGLRSQLMELRSRGSGSSDQFKLPPRSAFAIAGVAPVKPVVKKPEQPLHRGFGNADSFGDRTQTVSIPDPTAPANVLRAAAPKTPGLVATKEIKSSFSKTDSTTAASELPVGNVLSNQLKSSTSASQNESMVSNDFVGSPSDTKDSPSDTKDEAPPMLRASASEQVLNLELPRQLSQASLDALEQAKQDRLNLPLPEINQTSGPLIGGTSNPKVAPTQFQPPSTPTQQAFRPATTAFPGHFQTQAPAQQQQVTSNQFFNRAATQRPATETIAKPTTRVAEAKPLSASLPEGLTTGDGTYSPGSVRGLEKKLW